MVALIIGGIFNVVPRDGDRFTFQNANWNPVSLEQAAKASTSPAAVEPLT